MKLRKKPIKPDRKTSVSVCHYVGGVSLSEIQNIVNNPLLIQGEIDYSNDYGGGISIEFIGTRILSEEEYQKKLSTYNKHIIIWQKWYNDNKEEIELLLKKREEASAIKKEKRAFKEGMRKKRYWEKQAKLASKNLKALE